MNFNVISPETTEELLQTITDNRGKNFRFGAGYTDLILELKKQQEDDQTVINLARLNDKRFTSISQTDEGIRIGAMATASKIIFDKQIQKQFPVLHKAASSLASRQIRNMATIVGNLCTASPAGDIACALMVLEAKCEILNTNGKTRIVPITGFVTDVRKTVLKKEEVLQSILIHSKNINTAFSDFIKIGTRRSMECSVVSLAYHIQVGENDKITHAGIAIGSVAPTIKFVKSGCEYLIGKKFHGLSKIEKEEFANKILEYASPISDIRASAWYRKEVLFNISKSIFE